MNLSDIMQAAQGGQGINNLASQFGLSPQQAQAAIQAMIPAFSTGLQRTAQDPTGLGGLIAQMTNGAHAAGYADPNQAANASALGGGILSQIFGSPQIAQQIGQHAAQMSGVNAQVIQQMMPIVASMLTGGLAQSMASQGMGGILGQLAGAVGAPAAGAQAPPAGGLFGGIASMVGNLLGGGAPGSPQATAVQAGLNTLNSMFQAGVQVSQAHQQGLNDILNSITQSASRS